MMQPSEQISLTRNGWVPNNPRLPVLLYRSVFPADQTDMAAALEGLFRRNGWPPGWRDGVWSFHHYHSKAHETLGVISGTAQLVLGGPDGHVVRVGPGDVVMLPVGTGHCCQQSSPDFLVVGAYPPGQAAFDTCKAAPTTEQTAQIADLPPPATDPIHGVH